MDNRVGSVVLQHNSAKQNLLRVAVPELTSTEAFPWLCCISQCFHCIPRLTGKKYLTQMHGPTWNAALSQISNPFQKAAHLHTWSRGTYLTGVYCLADQRLDWNYWIKGLPLLPSSGAQPQRHLCPYFIYSRNLILWNWFCLQRVG